MTASHQAKPPLIYACAGCSDAGRLSYEVAQELTRRGAAQMSCLAGLACGKKTFVNQAAGREAWIVDGCPIECALGVMEHIGKRPSRHIRLHDFGIRKNAAPTEGFSIARFVDQIEAQVTQRHRSETPGAGQSV